MRPFATATAAVSSAVWRRGGAGGEGRGRPCRGRDARLRWTPEGAPPASRATTVALSHPGWNWVRGAGSGERAAGPVSERRAPLGPSPCMQPEERRAVPHWPAAKQEDRGAGWQAVRIVGQRTRLDGPAGRPSPLWLWPRPHLVSVRAACAIQWGRARAFARAGQRRRTMLAGCFGLAGRSGLFRRHCRKAGFCSMACLR